MVIFLFRKINKSPCVFVRPTTNLARMVAHVQVPAHSSCTASATRSRGWCWTPPTRTKCRTLSCPSSGPRPSRGWTTIWWTRISTGLTRARGANSRWDNHWGGHLTMVRWIGLMCLTRWPVEHNICSRLIWLLIRTHSCCTGLVFRLILSMLLGESFYINKKFTFLYSFKIDLYILKSNF